MQGIGPGTVLGGRYALRRRLSEGPELERWSAQDGTLEREVVLTVVGSGHPHRAAVLDAARRAAGVEDTRLIRILDVGSQSDHSFIVEEEMSGSESLATILLQGPLPAEEARRVAGESAKGLETAGQRGLHHLRLTPHHVMIAPDGAIRVRGVAVAYAIAGPDEREPDPASASRRDALRLAAVVYAALTGRWPLDEKVSGIEAAPRVIDGVVAPSEIAGGVPADLDALCRVTLNKAAGPSTPGDFANAIAPWPRARVQRAGADPTLVQRLPGSVEVLGGVPLIVSASAGRVEPTVAISTHDLPTHEPWSRPALPAEGPRPEQQAADARPTGSAPEPNGLGPAAVPVGDRASTAGADTAGSLGTALASAATAAGVIGSRLGSLARAAGESVRAGSEVSETEPMTLPAGLSRLDGVEPPLPLLPASTALPPSRSQARIVMLVMVAFVVLALIIGYRGLIGLGLGSSLTRATPRRTVTVSAPAVTVPASPAPQAAKTAAGPIAILSATGFDPQGDGAESNSQAARVYDGNLATSWSSELYANAEFGNLKKGVGVILDLGQPTSVHQVTIDLGNGPVDLTVYAATDPGLRGATVFGTASAASGHIQLKATSPMPEAQYVIVWFTTLAQDGGQFHASISEIALN